MATKIVVTTGGKERIKPSVGLLAPIFENDPVINYMLCSMPDKAAKVAYLPKYFSVLLSAAGLNGASFDETGNYECCSVTLPPGRRVDNTWTLVPAGFFGCLWKLGWSGCKRMLLEFEPLTQAAKDKVLKKNEKFFYIFFIGTRQDCQGRGLASDLIRHQQDIARAANTSIWLEATTSKSCKIYAKLGFEIVEEIVLGKGRAAADGTPSKGGEGVKIWAMLWRPEGQKQAG